jgi:hypothetical protein
MKMTLCQIACLMLMGGSSALAQAPASSSFAIVSPQVAAKLQKLPDSPTKQKVLDGANGALAREPDAVPHVHTEGTLPHAGIWDISVKAEEDWGAMLNLGLAWQMTHDQRYLHALDKYLNAWMDTYKADFNPIDETNFDRVIIAYDLAKADLPEATRTKTDAFLKAMSEGYLQQIQTKKDAGNWQSHRIKLATLTAYSLGDDSLVSQAKQTFDDHLKVNILPDGSTYDFHLRDALHYATYDLEPLTTAALAAKAHGQDWFHGTAGQPSLAMAIEWLVPYANGTQTHEEFVHSPVKFDAQRAQAGVPGFSGTWDPGHSAYLFQLASFFDPKYQAIVDELSKKGSHAQVWSTLLLQAGN